jgi:hypothetical protein
MSGPLYPRGKRPRYPFDRRLGGPQSRSGRPEEKIIDPTGTRTPIPLASRYTIYATSAPYNHDTLKNRIKNVVFVIQWYLDLLPLLASDHQALLTGYFRLTLAVCERRRN